MKKSGIYKITNPKGEVYIGCSQNIHVRWMNYKNSSKTAKQPTTKTLGNLLAKKEN